MQLGHEHILQGGSGHEMVDEEAKVRQSLHPGLQMYILSFLKGISRKQAQGSQGTGFLSQHFLLLDIPLRLSVDILQVLTLPPTQWVIKAC